MPSPTMKCIAYFKDRVWNYEDQNGARYWLPTVRTIQSRQLKMLGLRNSREYNRLKRESRRAPRSVVSSSFKFVDVRFYVKEEKKGHKVAFVQILDFAKRRVLLHWPPTVVTPTATRSPSPRVPSPAPLYGHIPMPILPRQGPIYWNPLQLQLQQLPLQFELLQLQDFEEDVLEEDD